MKLRLFLACAAMVAAAQAGASDTADHGDLPPAAQVEQAIHGHPMVEAAMAGVRAEDAHRARLEAGPHEFALKLSGQRRRDRLLDTGYREHEVGVERAIRLPGKAATDAELGAVGVEHARFALGDALHETGRTLLKSWFDWQREMAAVREWAAQVAILQRQAEAVTKRVEAGDAARVDALLAEAQLAQAQAQLAQAETRRDHAAIEIRQVFPAITLPERVEPSAPLAVGGTPDDWRQRIIEHNHELKVATLATRRSQLVARRLDADRTADPTLGVRLASERDGQERIVGLQLTIPLAGTARAAGARAGAAEADATGAREALVRARVEAEARRTVAAAYGSHAQWRRQSDVAKRMEDNANLLDKAWRLGEGQFGELLTARRQAIEAKLAASLAQLDANEARYRLLLDAHELWPLDDDHEH